MRARWSPAGPPGWGPPPRGRCTGPAPSVVIADLNAEKGEALAAELGERASFVEANVMEPEPVQAAVEAAAKAEGGLRISVCCAGIGWAAAHGGQAGPARPRDLPQRDQGQPDRHLQRAAARRRGDGRQRPRPGRRARRLRQHRLDRRLRRADRPGRLLGLEGRHRRPHPARRPRPGEPGCASGDDRARDLRHAAAGGAPRGGAPASSGPRSRSRTASASPRSSPPWPATSSRTRC